MINWRSRCGSQVLCQVRWILCLQNTGSSLELWTFFCTLMIHRWELTNLKKTYIWNSLKISKKSSQWPNKDLHKSCRTTTQNNFFKKYKKIRLLGRKIQIKALYCVSNTSALSATGSAPQVSHASQSPQRPEGAPHRRSCCCWPHSPLITALISALPWDATTLMTTQGRFCITSSWGCRLHINTQGGKRSNDGVIACWGVCG